MAMLRNARQLNDDCMPDELVNFVSQMADGDFPSIGQVSMYMLCDPLWT